MELSTLPALKPSCLLALRTSGLAAISRAADAAAAVRPLGVTLADSVRLLPWDGVALLAPVGASTAIAATRANDALPMTILLTRESPSEWLDRADR